MVGSSGEDVAQTPRNVPFRRRIDTFLGQGLRVRKLILGEYDTKASGKEPVSTG